MKPKALERDDFLARLNAKFPEVVAQIDNTEAGLLHCEVGAFLRATQAAMDAGRLWKAELYFRFVEELLEMAGPELSNALDVSYLEGLAFGECSPARHRAIKGRMPKKLRQILIGYHEQWR